MRVMLIFLSQYSNQPEAKYVTKYGQVTGAQTNEAPVRYALKRLAESGKALDKMIVFLTPKAKDTAYERFEKTVKEECSDIDIVPFQIPDDVTITHLLTEAIGVLSELAPDDKVIIETTLTMLMEAS